MDKTRAVTKTIGMFINEKLDNDCRVRTMMSPYQ